MLLSLTGRQAGVDSPQYGSWAVHRELSLCLVARLVCGARAELIRKYLEYLKGEASQNRSCD